MSVLIVLPSSVSWIPPEWVFSQLWLKLRGKEFAFFIPLLSLFSKPLLYKNNSEGFGY